MNRKRQTPAKLPDDLSDGYVKLFRKSKDSWVWWHAGKWHLWCWLLIQASWNRHWVTMPTGRGHQQIELLPGQLIYGRKRAARETGESESSIRRWMMEFVDRRMVTIQKNGNFRIATVCNWEIYQDADDAGRPQCEHPTDGTRTPNGHIQEGQARGERPKRDVDQIEVDVEEIKQLARRLFDKVGYAGNDGANLWKAAALRHEGLISEAELSDAATGAELNGHDKPAHFYVVLRNRLRARETPVELAELMRRVWLVPELPRTKPALPAPIVDVKFKTPPPAPDQEALVADFDRALRDEIDERGEQ